ncbi:unnamed protein product [Gadus morhua 'NCC']
MEKKRADWYSAERYSAQAVCSDIPLPRPRSGQRLQRRPAPHPTPMPGGPPRGEADGRAWGRRTVEELAPVGDTLQEETAQPSTMVYRRCGAKVKQTAALADS